MKTSIIRLIAILFAAACLSACDNPEETESASNVSSDQHRLEKAENLARKNAASDFKNEIRDLGKTETPFLESDVATAYANAYQAMWNSLTNRRLPERLPQNGRMSSTRKATTRGSPHSKAMA